jgi:hypothetical protein
MRSITREALRGLKAECDGAARRARIERVTQEIYDAVVHKAQVTTETSCTKHLKGGDESLVPDIIERLRAVLVDCDITHTTMGLGSSDGEWYTIPSMIPVHTIFASYIQVDWS